MKKYIYTIIVLLILGGGFYYYKNHQAKKAEANKPEYMTAEVSRKDIAIKVLSTGSLQPFTRVEVKGTIRGRIDEVFVNEGSIVKRGDVLATISSEERNSILDAADSMLRTARASGNSQEIREAQAALEIAQNAYKTVTILSSMEGEIISRTAEPGQNVDTSSQLFVIADRLIARTDVDEVDIAKIYVGLPAIVILDAYPDQKVEGKVTRIAREGRTVSDVVVYEINIQPDRLPQRWAPGMTANIEFILQEKKNVISVPRSAIVEAPETKEGEAETPIPSRPSSQNPQRPVGQRTTAGASGARRQSQNVAEVRPTPAGVRVIKDGEITLKRVMTGMTDGRYVEIISGIDEGETVVTGTFSQGAAGQNNTSRPSAGMRIRL